MSDSPLQVDLESKPAHFDSQAMSTAFEAGTEEDEREAEAILAEFDALTKDFQLWAYARISKTVENERDDLEKESEQLRAIEREQELHRTKLASSPALPNEHLRLNTRRRAISDLGSFGSIEVQPRWLPTELQRHILLLALPPLSYTTWNERCLTLKAASLVNKHWRDLAQPELLKHPQFKSAAAIEGYRCAALCAILRADDGLVQRVWTVESLRLRGGGSGWSMGGGLGGMDMVKLDEAWTIKQTHELMIDQSVAANLKRLVLLWPQLHPHLKNITSLSHLDSLAIVSSAREMAAYCSSCFGPAMPTLRHLALLDILIKQRAHWLEVSDRLLDVAPQLRSLAIHAVSSTPRSSSGATALLDLMPYLISLRYLDITLQPTVSILSLLLLLPSKLWSLRLGYPTPLANIKSIPDIHEALDYWPDSLKELKRLLLPSLVSSLGQICGEGRPIVAICARRNVSLVYIEARGKGIEDWEERIGDFKEETDRINRHERLIGH